MPYTSATNNPSPLAPPVITMTSSPRSTTRGFEYAICRFRTPRKNKRVRTEAYRIADCITGLVHG